MDSTHPIKTLLEQKALSVHSLPPEASVFDAVTLMAEKGSGSVLIMKDGKIVGVVSERDCARKIVLRDLSPKKTTLQDIMTSPVITVGPQETADVCMKIMTEKRIRHLPVVEGGKIVGVISIGDIVKWLVTKQGETIKHLENYISGSYPG